MAAGEEQEKDRGRNHTTSHSGEGTTLLSTEATTQKQHTTQNHSIASSVAISVHAICIGVRTLVFQLSCIGVRALHCFIAARCLVGFCFVDFLLAFSAGGEIS